MGAGARLYKQLLILWIMNLPPDTKKPRNRSVIVATACARSGQVGSQRQNYFVRENKGISLLMRILPPLVHFTEGQIDPVLAR